MGFCFVVAIWVLAPAAGAFAASFVFEKASVDQTTSEPVDYSLLSGAAQPFSFLDSLTVSSVGENRPAGLGKNSVSDPSPYNVAGMDLLNSGSLPDRSASYLFSFDKIAQENPYVGLARFDRFDVGQTGRLSFDEYRAEFMIGYNLASVGSILFGKGMQVERPGDTSLKLLDDGWRFKFIKKF